MRCDCESVIALLLTSSTASWTTQEIFTRLCLRLPLAGSTHYCHNYFTSIRQHFELTTVCRASQLIWNPVPASKSASYMRHCDTRVMPAVVSLSNLEDQVGACVHLSQNSKTSRKWRAASSKRERKRERERHMSPNPPTRRYLVSAFEQKKKLQTLDVLGCMYRYTSHHAFASRRQGSDDKGTYYLHVPFFSASAPPSFPSRWYQHRTINSLY